MYKTELREPAITGEMSNTIFQPGFSQGIENRYWITLRFSILDGVKAIWLFSLTIMKYEVYFILGR